MTDQPGRPASEGPEDLNFSPVKRMVPWLSPRQLTGTALQVVLSGIFGSYSDKREIQGSLSKEGPFRYTNDPDPDPEPDPKSESEPEPEPEPEPESESEPEPPFWFDFVADLGDAFGPTYTIASLLARDHLNVDDPGGNAWATERGKVLVMGGDQAYPTASVRAYENQLVGPYRAAFPYHVGEQPDLFVIPGNHDWYDGLTAFMRVFCREQWVGGWRTRQSRSYFALKLPHRWWLWGVDVQLDSYIDEPQFDYFQEMSKRLRTGDSVILCWPMPSWVRSDEHDRPEAYSTIDFFERKLIAPKAVVRLALTGDLHHYSRYVDAAGERHKITAGGGGAFLSGTHKLPQALDLPPARSRDPGKTSPPSHYRLAETFPDRKTSLRLGRQVWALPFRNLSFSALIAGVYLVYAWMVQATARSGGGGFVDTMASLSFFDVVRNLFQSPLAIVVTVALALGLAGFTKSKQPVKRWGLGLVHAFVHLGCIVLVIWGSAEAASALCLSGPWFVVCFVALVGVGGALLGGWVFSVYLFIADRFFSLNKNELFAAQRNRHYKCFVRFRIAEDGLTVYPIGVERTTRHWRLNSGGVENEPWFEPVGEPAKARLIEDPIHLAPRLPSSR